MENDKISYIPGIYNYCDSWCERCQLRTRCLNFKMLSEKEQASGAQTSEVFWDRFTSLLQKTYDIVKEIAFQKGINPTMSDGEPHLSLSAATSAGMSPTVHIICYMARVYCRLTEKWFAQTSLKWESSPPSAKNKKNKVQEAFQVIKWYQYQIYVKLQRAIKSAKRENTTFWGNLKKDSDGSAKVALIGIDRSIIAWHDLMMQSPEQADTICEQIVYLENLQARVEREFPSARHFIRPGFDHSEIRP